jgi:hypothetical protein
MASNRFRSMRNVSNRLVNAESRLSFLTRRPTPRKLSDNFIFTNNIRRYAIVTPLIADDAVTEDQIADDAVTEDQIADNAVTEDQIEIDAINGKNITSSNITDSDISTSRIDSSEVTNSTFDTIEGANFIVTDAFDMTNGVIKQVTISDDSLLEGIDVVLSGVTLESVFADTIQNFGGPLKFIGSPVSVLGGLVVDDGSVVMTVGDAAFGVSTGGAGIAISGGGSVNISASSFLAFSINDLKVASLNRVIDLELELEDLAQKVAGKANSGHSH